MNYEDKYKEALERAKTFQAKYGGDYAEYIFPELKESEDERMVRKIESFLSAYGSDYFSNDEWREIEVWLEKQKGQKPAEWSEEDERMLTRCIKSIECSKQFADSQTFNEAKDKEINWLKSLPLKLKKKNEDVAKLCSNEWSEEDKQILHSFEVICQRLIENPHGEKFEVERSYAKKMLSWLKSLRSSWKPSEEQMKALDKAIPVCIGVVGRDEVAPLESLYEQLKKL